MVGLTDDIPLDKVSFMLTLVTMIAPPAYFSIARERGIPLENLRGTTTNAPLSPTCIYGPPEKHYEEIPYKMRLTMDFAEFSIRNMPRWNSINVNGYVVREGGCSAAYEIAVAFSQALTYVDALIERGLTIDEILPRMSFTFTSHIDFFEEIAKFRAARRLWAKLIKERYNPKEEKTCRLKYHTNTAGESLQHSQPLNNVIRVTIEALAAVLGGTQSLQTCSYDEAIEIPTAEAQRLALRTQQIIAHESGVTNVVDPLGGSYYIEKLTDKLEEEMHEFMKAIDDHGGYIKAISTGWVSQKVREASLQIQQEIERGERIIVGTNAYADEPEEERPVESFQVPMEEVENHLENLRNLRETRDEKEVKLRVESLGEAASKPGTNLTEYFIDAARAGATAGEATGVVRMAHGNPYDVFEVLEYPFN
jgi:methylmalonyl-CoA mutase N-terminal domain/subunit